MKPSKIHATEADFALCLKNNQGNRMRALIDLHLEGYVTLTLEGERRSITYWTENVHHIQRGSFIRHSAQEMSWEDIRQWEEEDPEYLSGRDPDLDTINRRSPYR